ncbi:MAG: nuclear transport factor 2 family protein [Pseudomonadota bacterium]
MTIHREETVYRSFVDAINRGDLPEAFGFCTEGIVFRPIGSHPDLGREFKGQQDVLENCWLRVFEHLDGGVATTIRNIVATDGMAMAEFSGTGTGRRGMPYNNEYVHVVHFTGDKISRITEYLDTALINELMKQ